MLIVLYSVKRRFILLDIGVSKFIQNKDNVALCYMTSLTPLIVLTFMFPMLSGFARPAKYKTYSQILLKALVKKNRLWIVNGTLVNNTRQALWLYSTQVLYQCEIRLKVYDVGCQNPLYSLHGLWTSNKRIWYYTDRSHVLRTHFTHVFVHKAANQAC